MSEKLARFDNLVFPKMTKTKEGYLTGSATVTRCGVLPYMDVKGNTRHELRHEDDVFKTDSLLTMLMKPVTNDHPNNFVDSETAKKHQVGFTGERYDRLGDAVVVSMTITDKATIDLIEKGKNQVSMGYSAKLVPENGIYKGLKYDFRQTDIEYNHISIVGAGRAGDSIRIRMDGACILSDVLQNEETIIKKDNFMTNEIEQARFDALESKKDALEKDNELLKTRLDSATAKLANVETAYNTLKKDHDLEKAKKTDSVIRDAVNNKVAVLVQAAPYLGDMRAYFDHSVREIQIDAINSKRTDKIDFTDKDDSFVSGLFSALVDTNEAKRADSKTAFSVLKNHFDMSQESSLSDKMVATLQNDYYANRLKTTNNVGK